MNVAQFVQKWRVAKGGERQTAHEHFLDLCRLLGEQTPSEADPSGDFYAFEKGARRQDGEGFADVWLKNHFAWEYKGKGRDLDAAYKQVSNYREALGNPPLLVVCDIDNYHIHTNWTNTEKWIYRFTNDDLLADDPVEVSTVSQPAEDAPKLTAIEVLKALFEDPGKLKPRKTTDQITQEAAKLFGKISDELRKWKVDDMRIARFITRVLFCMFATDVGLLPKQAFSELIDYHRTSGDNAGFRKHLADLFEVMNSGGEMAYWPIRHFNGRLFEDNDVPDQVTTQEILILAELDALNWADVEPSIFGTLFERILDPAQRKKLGAHYTSRADIELIVEPVLMEPLRREWEALKERLEEYLYDADIKETPVETQKRRIQRDLDAFIKRLASTRVLDPACGSGNFLYVALALLKALEKEVIAFGSIHDVSDLAPRVHPRQLHGIETSPYAVELASVVIWIGYLQWKHRNAMTFDDEEPVLEPLYQIKHMDAIVDLSDPKRPVEPEWPEVDVIVGNPPFLGGKLLRRSLGDEYVDAMFAVWDERVPREADLCCYWFEKARAEIETGRAKRAGLLATQAIRGGKSRRVLERIKETGDIFYAQADRKWIQDGVAVRVSMVGFDDGTEAQRRLNEAPDDNPAGALDRALPVEGINSNLTSRVDLTKARRLKENVGISFIGDMKKGKFEVTAEAAERMLAAGGNPNGRSNSDVLRRWVNGQDITGRPRDLWIIDFPIDMPEAEAAKYERPYEHIKKTVKPIRSKVRNSLERNRWWVHARTAPDMRDALNGLERYIATVRLAKHRLFVFLPADVLPDGQLVVFARDDDYFFGVLHSRVHEVWARATGTQLREAASGFRYTPTTCFETFPFPEPADEQRDAVAAAARELNELRERWLNPPETEGGLGLTSEELKKRTLTSLYNERPTWLANAHAALDEAVFAAYGWPEAPGELQDAEILARLLALNLQREAV